MHHLAYSLLLLWLGWHLRGALQGGWRRNPKHHRFADSRHCWLEVAGVWHAFTDDALATARARADMLDSWFRYRWVNWLLRVAAVLALLWLLLR
jgi:hypothetical protein